ncbi:MAG: UDP-N-acetylglucosamine 2-epimerase (non-hydrolyzing) [Bacteroidales bacterium]|nr:UDP-N-acetylglucosamine 2-epimerase (non-hydrolyzing) [Bacteroidales bacterium]
MKLLSIVGARPNFMKIAPFINAINNFNKNNDNFFSHTLVHTGQHYDIRMSKTFFDDLQIPEPDINLEIGSGTHAEQVGKTMIELEKVIKQLNPDIIVVVGDVNAILAGAITAKKEHKLLAHIEAGLRSFDMTMPEEINRIVADRLSDYLFTPDIIANQNLKNEGVADEKIFLVGNIMIDTLLKEKNKAETLNIEKIVHDNLIHDFGRKSIYIEHRNYLLMTLHRPSNVDHPETLKHIISFIVDELCNYTTVLFPIHPRTMNNIIQFGLDHSVSKQDRFILLHPLRYHEMLRLNMSAKAVLTDSGGLQEECTVLGTPCFTMRNNTERPITLKKNGGLSILVGNNLQYILSEFIALHEHNFSAVFPPFWDGKTSERIVSILSTIK